MNRDRKIFHSEIPKREWPNLRRSFSKYCSAQGLPLPVRKDPQYPEYLKKWRHDHRVSLNSSSAERRRIRRKLFPEAMRAAQRRENAARRARQDCRVADNLRGRIKKALWGINKSARTIDLLGCSIESFKSHLGSLFKPGMTWKNYGPVWHVDHIKPCAKFDLTDPLQQKLCFNWSNLQPLFAKENMQKGDRYDATD